MSDIKIVSPSTGTATFTLTTPSGTSTDRTINIPDTAGDIVTTGDSGTISASMLDGGQSGSAPALAVRAYVNFNGTGTVAIRESVNVSSITDHNTGNYTANYTTAMASSDYSVSFGARKLSTGGNAFPRISETMSTTATRMVVSDASGTAIDSFTVCMTTVG